MGTTIPVALDSATKYQTLFTNNAGLYCGAEKLIPLTLISGQNVWLTGLQWSGSLNSGGASRATSSVHNIFSDILFQGTKTLQALQPAVYDSTNSRFFLFDASAINRVTLARLDPVAAITRSTSIVMSCRYSPSDYTSWTLALGPMYAVFATQNSTISPNVTTISASYALPVVTLGGNTVYFGSSLLDLNDGYLYLGGQSAVSGNYNHYLARIPWAYLYDLTHTEYYSVNGWSHSSATLTPMLTNVGPEISMWKASGRFYILAKMGPTNNTINLYSSSLIGQGYTVNSVAATTASPPSGGWGNGAYYVPGAQLASGKRLGFASNGIANDTYDKANPQFKKPFFFEF